ncbi:MAG: TonB C-terminal domain-containing protein [Deltaproteobacteria bacterium]|nr:TonB C-terminal domain-containing protein [Deltaproteobacteria bacterium]
MRRFFRADSFATFLLISAAFHLLFLLGWPHRRRTGLLSSNQIAIQLLARRPHSRRAAAGKRPVPRKKATVTKKKKIKVAGKAKSRPVKKQTAKRRRPPTVKKNALATIRKRYARAQQQRELEKIRKKLAAAEQPAAGATPAGQARVMLYAEQLKALITSNWNLPELLAGKKLSATVSLVIDRAGNLLEQKIERLSGNQLFDDSIMQAIKRAAPFPPFPPVMRQDREEFVITFEPRDLADTD